nr:inorganic diphosphatase [Ancylobacter crimeensis]
MTGLAAALTLLAAPLLAAERPLPFAFPQPKDTSEFYALIEIPAGSMTKYEIDADTGFVLVDRYMSMPVAYPANYGSIPSSLGGDGDPLDVLVYTREPIVPGAFIKVRPIGVLKMIDGGEVDDKIVAVPAGKIDPTYEKIHSMDDLPAIERDRLEAFFRVYKQLPAKSKVVEVKGYDTAEAAGKEVISALEAYRAKQPK